MQRANGVAPVVFFVVEIRRHRWWRRRRPVLRLTTTTVVLLALLTVALMLLDRRVPLALSLAPWALIAFQLVVWPGGRPCDGCGRWLHHRLDCQGRATR